MKLPPPRTSLLVWPCPDLDAHEPHEYTATGSRINGPVFCRGRTD